MLVDLQREIPRVIHFVWLGSEPGSDLLAMIERLRGFDSRWEIRLWRDHDLDWLANRSWFETSPTYAGRANIARYEIVLRHGGFYADADFEFLRSMDDTGIDLRGLVVVPERPNFYCNALFGAPAGHPFLARLVDRVGASIDADPTGTTQTTSGPHFFTKELGLWAGETGGKWTEIDSDLVFPYSFDRVHGQTGPLSPAVVAVHHWDQAKNGRAWVDGKPPSVSERRSVLGRLSDRLRPRSRIRAIQTRARRLFWRPNSLYLGDGRALTVGRAGRSIIFDTSDVNLLGHLVSKGEWDESFHRFLAKTLSGSDVYVDVGANIGQFVLTGSGALSRYGRVFAFEPNPRAADTLALNVRMKGNSGHAGEVTIRRVAVSDVSGSVTLHVPVFHAGRASIVPDALADVEEFDLSRVEVPCVTLDQELGRLSRIRLIKIDVEGNELAVLNGAIELIESGRVDLIDIESVRSHLGSRVVALGNLLDRWQGMGATFSKIDKKGGLVPLAGRASRIISTTDRSHLVIDMRPVRNPAPA